MLEESSRQATDREHDRSEVNSSKAEPEFSASSLLKIGLGGKNIAGLASKKVLEIERAKMKKNSKLSKNSSFVAALNLDGDPSKGTEWQKFVRRILKFQKFHKDRILHEHEKVKEDLSKKYFGQRSSSVRP